MFKPEYRFTAQLIKNLEKIAAQIAIIHASKIRLPLKLKLERELFTHSVHSSTWIEGNQLSLAQVESLSQHKDVSAEKGEKLEVENCLRAIKWVLKNKNQKFTEKGLLKLHALMTRSLLLPNRVGRYRAVQNYVVNAKRIVIFKPPLPEQIRRRMRSLLDWLSAKEVHPIIRSAIFHLEFVTIHPFTDGNGRVARAASQWLLLQKKYEPIYVLGLDDFFASHRAKYYEKIQQVRDLDYDFTHWLEYFTDGVLDAVQRVSRRIKDLTEKTKGKSLQLTLKQEELLKLLNSQGPLNSSAIGKQMQIKRARVNQLIKPLVAAGLVSKEGRARGTRYSLLS